MSKIQEPFVKCSFCGKTVPSKIAIRATNSMVLIGDGEIKTYPPGTTICVPCMQERGMI